jgi:hypothetical protein
MIELDELLQMKNHENCELLIALIDKAENITSDTKSSLRGNKAAGARVREALQDVKLIANIIRDNIQNNKGVPWGEKRKHSLDKAIEQAVERDKRTEEKISKKRQNRIDKLGQQCLQK